MNLHRRSIIAGAAALSAAPLAALAQTDKLLTEVIAGPQRSNENKIRDKFRHPAETLLFWGLKPGITVVEIMPGTGGYWTEILAPYLKATGGKYIGTGTRASRFAEEDVFGKVAFVPWGLNTGALVPAGTADLVFTSRNVHDWMWTPGMVDKAMKDFHAALKPGGVLGVEDHRADSRPMVPEARDGYVATAIWSARSRRPASSSTPSRRSTPTPRTPRTIPSVSGPCRRRAATISPARPSPQTSTRRNTRRSARATA
jgi:predicted methyltransferase